MNMTAQPTPADDYVRAHLEHEARNGQRRHDPDADSRKTREMPAIQDHEED